MSPSSRGELPLTLIVRWRREVFVSREQSISLINDGDARGRRLFGGDPLGAYVNVKQ